MVSPWLSLSLTVLLLSTSRVFSAPVGETTGTESVEGKADVPVEQLEKLKDAADKGPSELHREHVEFHSLDAVKADGELVSRLEQQGTADAVNGEPPRVHTHSQLDVPAEGVHVAVDSPPATPPNDELTTKVFHGAARLAGPIQPGSSTSNVQGTHTAARRAFNADITQETHNNMDHYAAYTGVQYSPLDMAEYVFWTGDERGVTTAIEDFLQEGLMSKEEAIAFLQEIKFNLDYLRAHYAQNAHGDVQQDTRPLMQQPGYRESQYRSPALQSFPFGNSPDIIRTIASKSWDMSNNLTPALNLPVAKRYDPMLQTNIISTSDYERDAAGSEEEYDEMLDRLKAADALYTEYTLEEIIYQLAKMMFSSSLSREPAWARAATRRFLDFLEREAERGQLSRSIEKKVLDIMVAALTDTVGEHPELRDALPPSAPSRVVQQYAEGREAAARAVLAAYQDELRRAPLAARAGMAPPLSPLAPLPPLAPLAPRLN